MKTATSIPNAPQALTYPFLASQSLATLQTQNPPTSQADTSVSIISPKTVQQGVEFPIHTRTPDICNMISSLFPTDFAFIVEMVVGKVLTAMTVGPAAHQDSGHYHAEAELLGTARCSGPAPTAPTPPASARITGTRECYFKLFFIPTKRRK